MIGWNRSPGDITPLTLHKTRTSARSLTAVPHEADRRPGPAWAEGTAIVMAAIKTGPAEIVPLVVIAVIARRRIDVPMAPLGAYPAGQRSVDAVDRHAVVHRLTIARQKAVAMPFLGRAFMRGRGKCQRRQQCEEDDNQGG